GRSPARQAASNRSQASSTSLPIWVASSQFARPEVASTLTSHPGRVCWSCRDPGEARLRLSRVQLRLALAQPRKAMDVECVGLACRRTARDDRGLEPVARLDRPGARPGTDLVTRDEATASGRGPKELRAIRRALDRQTAEALPREGP